MYSVKVGVSFSAAHNLRNYKGKCEELHGHNWKVEIVAASAKLDKTGILLDFGYLKEELNAVIEKLDHKYLNNLAYFKKVNPTSENIAKYIYDNIKRRIKILKQATVWENDKSRATYEPGHQ